MKTVLKTMIIALVVLGGLGAAGYYAFQSLTSPDKEINEAAKQAGQQLEQEEDTEAPKSGATPATIGMDEGRFQTMLHQMTHQKIVADKKRGAIEMTPETIDNMLKIARVNEGIYKQSAFYEKTLTAWEQGDFTNAVTVHNTIWDWHNGSVGRATGLMTAEQEARYVEDRFR
ncbi:DUF6241 domain-containing protein [Planococcus sp. ISL-109]|uniref:DUF6241 domain-containing protein n=1 Tax=Planococcus sp. ISL-109 TaxID=2819166 RepID=UPI001BE75C98|nr:DUF6241 domain-containing protein [Planococcus sp. ISL-109]MBT2581195.1 hypothetical protein [Planococcus sp. ISL-109]